DLAHTCNGSGAARGSMHAAGVELDNTIFVRQSAVTDAVIVRVVFLHLEQEHDCVKRIVTAREQRVSTIGAVVAVRRRDQDRALEVRANCFFGDGSFGWRWLLRLRLASDSE